jgi:hypothetical protein
MYNKNKFLSNQVNLKGSDCCTSSAQQHSPKAHDVGPQCHVPWESVVVVVRLKFFLSFF